MANPGYPQQPMQPPHMQQQPMQQMPPQGAAPKPVKRGSSKIVPVVVSAGLAVGTFCGLLFGVGTGEVADASPSTSETKKDEPKQDDSPNPAASAKPETKPAEVKPTVTAPASGSATQTAAAGSAAPAAGSAATPAAGSAATPAAGSGSTTTAAAGSAATTPPVGAGAGSAAAKPTVAEPAIKKPKLTVEVTPESVGATAKITVDGKAIEGNAVEIDLGKDAKKEVKIVVKASGYKTVEQKVEIDSDVAVKIELIKRPSTPAGGTSRPSGGGTPVKKKPPGGLIDI